MKVAIAVLFFAAAASASSYSFYGGYPYALPSTLAINPYGLHYPLNPYFTGLRFAETKHHTSEHKEEKDAKPANVAELKLSPLNYYTGLPLAYSVPAPAPLPLAALPATHQFHSQDELGQYHYGYNTPLSSKSELKTFDGITRGGYSYIDSEGKVQSVNYISDAAQGFRVAATNLPVAPKAPEYQPLASVMEAAEVAEARKQHLKAHEDALELLKKTSTESEKKE